MAIRKVANTMPVQTRAGRFFTMTSMEVNERNMNANEEVITNLIVPGGEEGSLYMPDARGSSYSTGMINSMILGEGTSQYGWMAAQALTNDAVINQAATLSAMGSVSMSFNLSENVATMAREVEDTLPVETDLRDPEKITREIEKVICESVVKSSNREEFTQRVQGSYQDAYFSAELLGNIYNDLQFMSTVWSYDTTLNEPLVSWQAIANGTAPVATAAAANPQDVDPIEATNLVVNSVTALSGISIYEETSPEIQNAVLVNNLVMSNMSAIAQGAARRGVSSGGGSGGGGGGGY